MSLNRRRAVTIGSTPTDLDFFLDVEDTLRTMALSTHAATVRQVRRPAGRCRKTGAEAWVVQHDIDRPQIRHATPAPAPLPAGELGIAFHTTEAGSDVPPAFYPGQSIPTVLTFTLPPGTSLPLSLNPSLTLSLLGTLTCGAERRVLIDISVSLAEGLALWARDAGAGADGTGDLPAGNYTLPLSAQVPSSPRLPPTFSVRGAAFTLTYSLCVSLACNAPRGRRARVAHASASFELLPATLPAPAPRILPHSFWVPDTTGATERWVLRASLPTGTYSPTSVVPLELAVHPPRAIACAEKSGMDLDLWEEEGACMASMCSSPCASSRSSSSLSSSWSSSCSSSLASSSSSLSTLSPDTAIVARISLVRTERIGERTAHHAISSRVGWIPLHRDDRGARRACASIPLILGSAWEHGFTTVLTVDADDTTATTEVSSTFQLVIDVLFLPLSSSVAHITALLPPASSTSDSGFLPPRPGSQPRLWTAITRYAAATARTLSVPLTIGSVSEPSGAMHAHTWSEVTLDAAGDPAGLVSGDATTDENGWMCPPPAYECAIQSAPYVY